WRTTAGTEVDLIVDTGERLIPIEVKLSATPHPAMTAAIKTFQKDFGDAAGPGYIIHPGDTALPLGADVSALPLLEL
ncbi:MAG: GTP-binding protein, partial [Thermodesulfobacteriota bacterium]|nr:GTP-binding protein [Thermodesulfobacteriota bacterium]